MSIFSVTIVQTEQQGGLIKDGMQLNLSSIFSFSIFNEIYLFTRLTTLNHVKLGHAVIFLKYRASIVCLIFLPKILNWNNITFLASNLLNLAGLVVN